MRVNRIVTHKNGFLREDKSNKIDYTLIPLKPLSDLAKHYTDGAKIHGVDNWKKAEDVNTFKQSAFRHFIAILESKEDEDHYSALIWNIISLAWHNKYKENENMF